MLIAIWAMDEHQLIGRGNDLPWRIPAELNHFRRQTMGQTILVGRVTFAGLPLSVRKHRTIMVASRNKSLNYNDAVGKISVVNDLFRAIADYRGHPRRHLYVIGGRQIYRYLWSYFDQLVVSYVPGSFTGDVYFPAVDWQAFAQIRAELHPQFKVIYYRRRQ